MTHLRPEVREPTPGSNTAREKRAGWGRRVGVRMRHVAGKRGRVTDAQSDLLVSDVDADGAPLDLHQLPGAGRMRLADVPVGRAQGPVPQLDHIGRLDPATRTPRPPDPLLHNTAPSPRRVTFTGLGRGGSTNAGSPTPSASLILSSVPTLGFAEPCSTLTTIRRLTPAASAS